MTLEYYENSSTCFLLILNTKFRTSVVWPDIEAWVFLIGKKRSVITKMRLLCRGVLSLHAFACTSPHEHVYSCHKNMCVYASEHACVCKCTLASRWA
jgi:hypothetical protein